MATVIIDDEDLHLLQRGTWRFHESKKGGKRYLQWATSERGAKRRIVFHRHVMGAEPGKIVDHRNGDTRDNRKENLRLADRFMNAQNAVKARGAHSSRFKGVSMKRGYWCSYIMANGVSKYVISCRNEVEAAYRYDLASIEVHGEHGRTNFLPLVR